MEMLILWIFLMILGFALLVKGADWFVDGAAGIAGKCHISALVIGLTIVAFGTSAPELAVSVNSAIHGVDDFAVGNVLGSNVLNILLILGISALIRPLPVQKSSLRLDIPFLIGASALILGLGVWGEALNWWDGLILLVVFAGYMVLLFLGAKKGGDGAQAEEPERPPRTAVGKWFKRMEEKTWFLIILTIVGLAMVVGGSQLLVKGAQYIAESLSVPKDVIGLTVVALGTSLPELVTSIVAARKGETDIAVGNIIGSNIFNIFFVAGIASLFAPLTFSMGSDLIDACVGLGAAVLLFSLALLQRKKLGRISGAVMLLCFIAYYVYLFVVRI